MYEKIVRTNYTPIALTFSSAIACVFAIPTEPMVSESLKINSIGGYFVSFGFIFTICMLYYWFIFFWNKRKLNGKES